MCTSGPHRPAAAGFFTGFCTVAAMLAAPLPAAALAQASGPDTLAPPAQREVIEQVISILEERYVFPETAASIADALRRDLGDGVYDEGTGPAAFADRLTGRIRDIARDGHLWVMHDPEPVAPADPEPVPDEEADRRRRLARTNHGLPRAEILRGNVGYLDIRQFVDPALGGDVATAAMAFLADADALILDVRQSMGGSPRMVTYLASHLFEEPVHLFDVYLRPEDRTEQHWTASWLPSRARGGRPVYVLTRASTFSAGEGLAYVLQQLDRAVVVGETTAGGANPGGFHRLPHGMVMFVAEGRVTSPVTDSNWEGVGVTPDVGVPHHLALDHAHLLALEHLRTAEGDVEWARELQDLIDELAERLRREQEARP